MRVVLQQPVKGLGAAKEIVDVSEAYARNYLLPKKLASAASASLIERAAKHQLQAAKATAQQQAAMTSARQALDGRVIRLTGRASPSGRLFAAIKSDQIIQTLERQLHLRLGSLTCQPDHLKTVGAHRINLVWPGGESVWLTIEIQAEGGATA